MIVHDSPSLIQLNEIMTLQFTTLKKVYFLQSSDGELVELVTEKLQLIVVIVQHKLVQCNEEENASNWKSNTQYAGEA